MAESTLVPPKVEIVKIKLEDIVILMLSDGEC